MSFRGRFRLWFYRVFGGRYYSCMGEDDYWEGFVSRFGVSICWIDKEGGQHFSW